MILAGLMIFLICFNSNTVAWLYKLQHLSLTCSTGCPTNLSSVSFNFVICLQVAHVVNPANFQPFFLHHRKASCSSGALFMICCSSSSSSSSFSISSSASSSTRLPTYDRKSNRKMTCFETRASYVVRNNNNNNSMKMMLAYVTLVLLL